MFSVFHSFRQTPRQALVSLDARLDGVMRAAAAFSAAALIGQWAFIVAFLVPRFGTLDFLRLHYTAGHGVDWIGPWYAIFAYPGIGFAVLAVNLAIAVRVARVNRGFARVVLISTAFLETLLAAAGAIAVLLNG